MIGTVTIVADENIPFAKEAFSHLGRVRLTPGRAMTAAVVKDADVLLVRSVTRVDRALLHGSAVRMVATATIGTDHIDLDYLQQHGIAFASAAGSNANSVAEWLTAALLAIAEREKFRLAGKVIGVVGVGNVGSKVVRKCQALGLTVLQNDPPLQQTTSRDDLIDLPDLIVAADIVTLHVPLTIAGPWPTHHMVNADFLKRLKPNALLINASRGPVVDEHALDQALWSGHIRAILDVWENEPDINADLLAKSALATPHIAGYSFDGKVNGADMIYQAVCRFLGEKPLWQPRAVMPVPPVPLMQINPQDQDTQTILHNAVRRIYDIQADDKNLRELLTLPELERPKHFDQLRKHYSIRREFPNTRIEFLHPNPTLESTLRALGFQIT